MSEDFPKRVVCTNCGRLTECNNWESSTIQNGSKHVTAVFTCQHCKQEIRKEVEIINNDGQREIRHTAPDGRQEKFGERKRKRN